MNWHDLNAILPLQSEEQVLRLLTEEVERRKRVSFIVRLHQRYTSLRAARERKELLAKAEREDNDNRDG